MQITKSTPDLYQALLTHTQAVLGRGDQKEEAHLACPACGHVSSPKSPHCSFSPRGWKCFVCGSGGSLLDLAKRVGLEDGRYIPPILVEQPVRKLDTPRWMATDVANRLLWGWEHHPDRFDFWQTYKPLTEAIIRRKRLGVGKLPQSQCQHDRLIVPIFDVDGQLVGIRGRALACRCPKWLVAKGTTPARMPLYNADALTPGCVVWVVENPIDALMVNLSSPFIGVASYSTSYWEARWTATLLAVQPEFVIIAYDNDLVGNGGALRRNQMITAWQTSHPGKVPPSRGVKLVNHLLAAGLPAALFDWRDMVTKADIGSLLMQQV